MMKILQLVNQKRLVKRKLVHGHFKNLLPVGTHAQIIHTQFIPRIFHVVIRLYPNPDHADRHPDLSSPEYPVTRIFHLHPADRSPGSLVRNRIHVNTPHVWPSLIFHRKELQGVQSMFTLRVAHLKMQMRTTRRAGIPAIGNRVSRTETEFIARYILIHLE